MNSHKKWLREQGLGKFIDDRPDFLNNCDCNGSNMDEVCRSDKCAHYEDCQKYFQPMANALERHSEIGEV